MFKMDSRYVKGTLVPIVVRYTLIAIVFFLVVGIVCHVFLLRWRVEYCPKCALARRVTYLDLLPGKWGHLTIHKGPAVSRDGPTLAEALSKYSSEPPCVHDWRLMHWASVTTFSRRVERLRRLVGTTFKQEFLCGGHGITCVEAIAEQDSELAFAIVRTVLDAPTAADVKREYLVLLEVDCDIAAGADLNPWREAYGLLPPSVNNETEPAQSQAVSAK